MATRNHVQISQDLVRFINITNDLIDGASYFLQEIDPTTGTDYVIVEQSGAREPTFGELKTQAQNALQAVLNYEARIKNFIQNYGVANMVTAVQCLSLDAADLQNDLNAIADESRYILSGLGTAADKSDLITLGQHIDATIPKLDLVRKSWRYDL
jgi:hypothetical protein